MAVNARTEEFQHIEVFDKPALFTNGRIARDTVPEGWYCYDIRGSDDDPGELCYMEENVVVNHAGSVLMPEKLAMPKSGRLDVRDELGFLDEGNMTLREFCEVHQLSYPAENMKFHIRPARPEEAGLFYTPHPEEDMQRGEATINYYNLYAYEKGPDGKPRIIPEQAEVVKEIYAHYLRGDSLPMICRYLEAQHIPNIRGGTTWGHSAVRGILSNEKYVGDVLMQKTFRQDCISHKAIRNTGQRPMYLVQNNHEAIIDRKTYEAAQTELARRTAIKGTTEKSTPSGRSSYMPMYALSERVFCGECGTRYRRCTWVNKGKKHIVWRCVSRIDYGKKYCHTSPSVDEQQLQQAILRAINSVMSDKPTLVRQVTENLQVVIHPSRSGELTIAEIDHQLETLAQEFDTVFTTVTSGNSADYIERFKVIFAQQAELKAKRAELKQQQTEDAELTSHMEQATDTLEQAGTAITEWDEYQIRALVESVRILSKDEILVRLKSGIEKIERLQR